MQVNIRDCETSEDDWHQVNVLKCFFQISYLSLMQLPFPATDCFFLRRQIAACCLACCLQLATILVEENNVDFMRG